MKYFDCVVIGAGAAGLMCASTAGQRGLSVAILDHANKVGKKILMSGGGRCNFTNYFVEPANFISNNPHFCKSALSRYTQYDFLALVDKYQLQYHEKVHGQLFCNNKAKDILAILLNECEQADVQIFTDTSISKIDQLDASENAEKVSPAKEGQSRFSLSTSLGPIKCRSLVVATGGLSIPTMGATGFGYDIAKQFGIKVTPVHAALVPFTFDGEALLLCQNLAGLSLEARVQVEKHHFLENILFTHKGLSGPAILQISNYWWPGNKLTIDFSPSQNLSDLLQEAKSQALKLSLLNLLGQKLPKRFVQAWCELHFKDCDQSTILSKNLAELSNQDIEFISQLFHNWQIVPKGTEGYRTAEVTRGGVDTNAISSKTFEAKNVCGLYFVGEVLDVTGWLGGFNFQWAWASGYCAAQSV